MSMEKAMRRNTEASRLIRYEHRIAVPTEAQRGMTEKWILPYEKEITSDAEILRHEADMKLQKDPAIRKRLRERGQDYPHGLCKFINNEVFSALQHKMLDRSRPGLQAMKNFIREGGLVRPFWGIHTAGHFQNAIQIGSAALDVANDTESPAEPAVVFHKDLSESPLKNIESFSELADIASMYWKWDVYPNIYFPEIAPLYPMVVLARVKKKGGGEALSLEIPDDVATLWAENMFATHNSHVFSESSDFIFHSKYSAKRLPPEVIDKLFPPKHTEMRRLEQKYPHALRVTADPQATEEVFNRFQTVAGQKPSKKYVMGEIDNMYAIYQVFKDESLVLVENTKPLEQKKKPA